jgi:Tfp pilus assembly protein PilN
MRAVNLLPRETSGRQFKIDRALVAAVAFTVVVVAALAGGFALEKAHASTERQRLAAVQAALAKAESQQPTTHSPTAKLQVPVVLSQQQPWHVALAAALASRVAWDTLLSQLEYAVPDRVSLTNVAIGSAGSTAGAASGTVTIGGNAFSTKDVADFLATLARIPHLTQVTLVSSTANPGTSTIIFQISAQLALPAPAGAPATGVTTTTTPTGA